MHGDISTYGQGGAPWKGGHIVGNARGLGSWVAFRVQIHVPFKEGKVKASPGHLHSGDWCTWEACVGKGLLRAGPRDKQLAVGHRAPAHSGDGDKCTHTQSLLCGFYRMSHRRSWQ